MIPASPITADKRMTLTAARRVVVGEFEWLRRRYDAGDERWRSSALRIVREYFRAIGVESGLLLPLETMLLDERDRVSKSKRGRPKMPSAKLGPLGMASMAVDVLLERRAAANVTSAIKMVSDATGISRREIMNFRDQLNRGKYGSDVQTDYRKTLDKVGTWPTDALIEAIQGIGTVLNRRSKSRR